MKAKENNYKWSDKPDRYFWFKATTVVAAFIIVAILACIYLIKADAF
jgi:hypothetical protein